MKVVENNENGEIFFLKVNCKRLPTSRTLQCRFGIKLFDNMLLANRHEDISARNLAFSEPGVFNLLIFISQSF